MVFSVWIYTVPSLKHKETDQSYYFQKNYPKKQVSMIRKYHNYTLQTNHETTHREEQQNTDCHKTSGWQSK